MFELAICTLPLHLVTADVYKRQCQNQFFSQCDVDRLLTRIFLLLESSNYYSLPLGIFLPVCKGKQKKQQSTEDVYKRQVQPCSLYMFR